MSKAGARGNFIGEWFGYRLYPSAHAAPDALATWRRQICPYLTSATGEDRTCVKADKSKGVCSINTETPNGRRDWLVCPYRAFDSLLMEEAVRRLFNPALEAGAPLIMPAVRLAEEYERERLMAALHAGANVYIYLDQKLGGEVSIPKTARSPEFSIDVTILELTLVDGQPEVHRFGALEIQTMDFHGSYEHAVKNLKDGLRLHPERFGEIVDQNQGWLSDKIEGPNLANVFKRTFYQMAFKFQLGQGDGCVGTALAIPKPVWESWRHLLGDPELSKGEHSVLSKPGEAEPDRPIAWILSFDLVTCPNGGPDRIRFDEIIATSAAALSYWALEVAPLHALEFAMSEVGIPGSIKRLLMKVWPELGRRVHIGESKPEQRGSGGG